MRLASTALFLICTVILTLYAAIRLGKRPDVNRPVCEAQRIVQLDNGFSSDERQQFYHRSFGSEMLPKDWLLALVNPNTQRPLLQDLERFGLRCDPDDPQGLPIGLSTAPSRVLPSERLMVGMNCSICHVADLRYRGKDLRIDGAPSQFDGTRFVTEFGQSIHSTLKNPKRLYEFLRRLHALRHKSDTSPASRGEMEFANLRQRYQDAIKLLKARKQHFDQMAALKNQLGGTPAGPGRADTWVTGRNSVFPQHATPWTSPSSYPHLWGYDDANWLTWNGTTRSGADRDVATALGMMSFFDLETYKSSVSPQALFDTDRLLRKLSSPKWPGQLFGAIDPKRSARGKRLYATHCARCHDQRTLVPVDEVGTDRQHMRNYHLLVGDQPFHEAFPAEMRKFKELAYKDNNVSRDEIDRFENERPNRWRASSGYVARPLSGAWATAPYLHNGSVPTMYDLLLPAARRPARFTTGSPNYDPAKLGFVSDPADERLFLYDTTIVGNSNQGHEYGTNLNESDRLDLLEYLKGR